MGEKKFYFKLDEEALKLFRIYIIRSIKTYLHYRVLKTLFYLLDLLSNKTNCLTSLSYNYLFRTKIVPETKIQNEKVYF